MSKQKEIIARDYMSSEGLYYCWKEDKAADDSERSYNMAILLGACRAYARVFEDLFDETIGEYICHFADAGDVDYQRYTGIWKKGIL